ncbi:hypothetical protein HHJ79_06645 [Mobiluncus mulieris]|nr:hypothetical protein [Mobiluncus mulieris]
MSEKMGFCGEFSRKTRILTGFCHRLGWHLMKPKDLAEKAILREKDLADRL